MKKEDVKYGLSYRINKDLFSFRKGEVVQAVANCSSEGCVTVMKENEKTLYLHCAHMDELVGANVGLGEFYTVGENPYIETGTEVQITCVSREEWGSDFEFEVLVEARNAPIEYRVKHFKFEWLKGKKPEVKKVKEVLPDNLKWLEEAMGICENGGPVLTSYWQGMIEQTEEEVKRFVDNMTGVMTPEANQHYIDAQKDLYSKIIYQANSIPGLVFDWNPMGNWWAGSYFEQVKEEQRIEYNRTTKASVKEVREEIEKAKEKYPDNFKSLHEGYGVLKEEVDELWDEIKKKQPDPQKVHTEAKQVAAMAVRIMNEFKFKSEPCDTKR